MSNSFRANFRRMPIVKFLYESHMMYFGTLWLLVLLVVGTVAQKDMGLHLAQEKYFSSWVIWAFSVPLPGGRLTMAAISLSLLAKLLFASKWRLQSAGVITTHAGILLLFIGGFVTAMISYEGTMSLAEGQRSSIIYDSHLNELAVVATADPAHNEIVAFHGSFLKDGKVIQDDSFPAKIKVVKYFDNCLMVNRESAAPSDHHGMAERFEFEELQLNVDQQNNSAGIILDISGLDKQNNGRYMLLANMTVPQTLEMDGKSYQIALRQKRYVVPFVIELIDFERQVHPGTEMARSYSSDVNLIEGDYQQHVKIEMNAPLRHKGYTFFQSSFSQNGDSESSIFAVVHNPPLGQWSPYVCCIVSCLGLLLHLILQLPRLVARREKS